MIRHRLTVRAVAWIGGHGLQARHDTAGHVCGYGCHCTHWRTWTTQRADAIADYLHHIRPQHRAVR